MTPYRHGCCSARGKNFSSLCRLARKLRAASPNAAAIARKGCVSAAGAERQPAQKASSRHNSEPAPSQSGSRRATWGYCLYQRIHPDSSTCLRLRQSVPNPMNHAPIPINPHSIILIRTSTQGLKIHPEGSQPPDFQKDHLVPIQSPRPR